MQNHRCVPSLTAKALTFARVSAGKSLHFVRRSFLSIVLRRVASSLCQDSLAGFYQSGRQRRMVDGVQIPAYLFSAGRTHYDAVYRSAAVNPSQRVLKRFGDRSGFWPWRAESGQPLRRSGDRRKRLFHIDSEAFTWQRGVGPFGLRPIPDSFCAAPFLRQNPEIV